MWTVPVRNWKGRIVERRRRLRDFPSTDLPKTEQTLHVQQYMY
jgi:hypothetical protein